MTATTKRSAGKRPAKQRRPAVGASGKSRSSNLELLRIVAMLLIIAHHFVVNSGVTNCYDFSHITPNMVFLQLWGMWGKTAINVFVMISGYFMCTSKLTVKRFGKVYLEAKFYKIIIFFILLLCGYETPSFGRIFKLIFGLVKNVNNGFTASFLMFYLLIPFYNLLLERLNKRQHLWLIGLLLFYFTIDETFLKAGAAFHESGWYIVLYFIAAYIRLYPEKWMESGKICGRILLVCLALSYASVLAVDFVGVKVGFEDYYCMVSDSNRPLALLVGVFAFLFFKNWKIKNSPFINRVAATTFGVFCIHASSEAMRTFLWKDLLRVLDSYTMPTGQFIVYAAVCVAGIFVVCSLLDMLRIRWIEKPVFAWLDKYKWFHRELY